MDRKLDFIVLGTGRSGTSAVARYLSAVNGVHCGLEIFSPWIDHSKLHPPACFENLADDDLPSGVRRPKSRLLQFSLDEIHRRNDSLRYFGNKTPNYIFRLGGLLDEIAPGRAIVCWRDVRSIAESYARRADDPDDNWEPGKRAIFAVADMMVCIQALADLRGHDVMIVPNRAVVADWDATTRKMIAFLLPDFGEVAYDPVNLAAIKRRRSFAGAAPRSLPNLTPSEMSAIETIEQTGLDSVMNRESAFMLSEVTQDLRDIMTQLPNDIGRYAHALAQEDGRAAGIGYFEKWARMHNREQRLAKSASDRKRR